MTRVTIAAVIAAICSGAAFAASEPGWPTKPIRVIVPSQAGGGADIVARMIGQKLTDAWGQQVVIDNRIGAVGAEIAAKAPPDGQTLMFTTSALSVREALYAKPGYDTKRDFQPVTQVLSQSNVLVVHPSLAVTTVPQLIALAKSKPGQLNYGSGGNGTSNHLAGVLFQQLAGIDVVHVPYKGVPAALIDTVAGRMHYTIGSPVSTLPHVKEGRLRLIAVTTPKRSPRLPNVPTIAESLPGYEFTGWMGFFAPIKVARPIADKLYRETRRIVYLPDVKQKLQLDAAEPVGSTPTEFSAYVASELARWTKVVKAGGIKVE
ncbi:MAG TPA: tripartite tricarboxylate transporter substrate binding protein [Burkholderiales bacterium]|nr:tripartite tricarboxylate transporter substrate binding protein [Burkholderiales bacterium]